MSSFICGSTHFNSIEQALNNLFCYDQDFHFYVPEFDILTDRRNQSHEAIEKEIHTLVDSLRSLNVLAVVLQYSHHYEGRVDQEIKEQVTQLINNQEEHKSITKLGLYKALCCLNYQIEIDRVKDLGAFTEPYKKAYSFMEYMINGLAHYLVNRMIPEYENLAWEVS